MHMQTLSQLCMAEGSHAAMMGRDAVIKDTSWAILSSGAFPCSEKYQTHYKMNILVLLIACAAAQAALVNGSTRAHKAGMTPSLTLEAAQA